MFEFTCSLTVKKLDPTGVYTTMHWGDKKKKQGLAHGIISQGKIGGPRTRVGQPQMKYWKLHELHKNEVHPI